MIPTLIVLALVLVVALVILSGRRRSDTIDRGVRDFRREMRALAPDDESARGPQSEV